MLSLLRIQNFAIVDDLEVDFGPGLNVVTGETGAGKSVLLKAIEALIGKRSSADVIRAGAENCIIEGIFQLPATTRDTIDEASEEFSELLAEPELLIRRVIDLSGRSKMYLNGSLSTAGVVQQLAPYLLDITGQHSQVALLEPETQLKLLDQFGVPSTLLAEVREAYQSFAEARKLFEKMQAESSHREYYLRQLRAEREELTKAALVDGEEQQLEGELKKLANVETLALGVGACLEICEASDNGITVLITRLDGELKRMFQLDPSLRDVVQLVQSARVELQEVQFSFAQYLSRLKTEPQRLEAARERISEIKRLTRKYQKSVTELVRYLKTIDEELQGFESGVFDEEALRKRVATERARLTEVETRLSAERKRAAAALIELIEKELALLHMQRAKFAVDISKRESSALGADNIVFQLAANPGEPFRPLASVASGGELSRIVLVLKTILNEKTGPLVQVFDEVDAGIGGAVAQIVGERLKSISHTSQVILVTHAPQIAAFADSHFVIEKQSTAERTTVTVRSLNDDSRVQELARMLAGKKVTEKFEDSARELVGLSKDIDCQVNTSSARTNERRKKGSTHHNV